MDIIQTLIGGLLGGGLIGLIEFLIRRRDEKADKKDEVLKAISDLSDKVDGIEHKMDEDKADSTRRMILLFDDELRREVAHSEESYNQIMESINFYNEFCDKHKDYRNAKAVNAIKHIDEVYSRVKAENRFI